MPKQLPGRHSLTHLLEGRRVLSIRDVLLGGETACLNCGQEADHRCSDCLKPLALFPRCTHCGGRLVQD